MAFASNKAYRHQRCGSMQGDDQKSQRNANEYLNSDNGHHILPKDDLAPPGHKNHYIQDDLSTFKFGPAHPSRRYDHARKSSHRLDPDNDVPGGPYPDFQ